MRSIRLWGLRDPAGEMRIVETMARAYVAQKEHPDWEAFVLRVPESGIYEIEDGPIKIIGRRGRLYGDTTRPVIGALSRASMAMTIGWSFGQVVSGHSLAWIAIIIINLIGLCALNRAENLAMGRALHDGIGFFKEVQRLSGPDEAYAALNACVKGASNVGSAKDDGKSERDR